MDLRMLCGGMALLAAALVIKLILLYTGMKEIRTQLSRCLSEETNNVIYVSGNDRHLKALAGALNRELRTLRGMRHRYQSGDRELKEAVTNISHDLRTPLAAVYGYLELLEREEIPAEAARYLGLIKNRADAMRRLTGELFVYAVALAEDDAAFPDDAEKRENVTVNRVLCDSLLAWYDIFRERQIEPEIIIPEAPVVCCVDPEDLSRVFGNLLDNVAKYSDGDLRVELTADGVVTFCNRAAKLDTVTVGRLFDRFYTVETGRGATGLGLAIAKLLAERMGANLAAEYDAGVLTMRLTLGHTVLFL